MSERFLEATNISKAFSGVRALQDVSIAIDRGRIHCLVGENGCGKSTLIKVIAGVYQPDAGQIIIGGKSYERIQPIDAIREGIQVIYQDFSLFPNLTVAENIALNSQLAEGRRTVNWREARRVAKAALERIGVRLELDARVEQMSVANKQLIAISKALLQDAKLIIMDEPTTALTRREVKRLFEVIRTLQASGVAFLFVSHKLNEVLELSERITVMRNAKKVIEGEREEFDAAKLVYYMTGQELSEKRYEYAAQPGAPLLEVKGLSAAGAFSDVDLTLRPGEIVGVTGLLGSGRTELALALFGVQPADAGEIRVDGQQVRIGSIQDAVRAGIGYVPEDRLTEGLFLQQSIGSNIIVRTVDRLLGNMGLIDRSRKAEHIERWVEELRIKTASPALPVMTLSGGNQQRVVLAKWLAGAPRILVLNGPTMGVDVGSKEELHEIMKQLARGGMGLLLISDDIPELLQTCNRILLMRRGSIAEEFPADAVNEDVLARKLTEA